MLQRRRCRCCVSGIIILVICIAVFYFSPFSAIESTTFHNYVIVNKYPDFRKYAKNIGDKLGLDRTLNIINGDSGTDLNGVPLRLLIKDNKDIPKYLPNKNALKSDVVDTGGELAIPKLVILSGHGHNKERDMNASLDTQESKDEGDEKVIKISVDNMAKDIIVLDSKQPPELMPQTSKEIERMDTPQEQLKKQVSNELSGKITTDDRPVHVVIVTNRRSGSSFLGQIFNQNPDVFFHFEPLKLTEWKKELYPNATNLVLNMLKCRFDATPFLMEMYNHEILHRESSKVLTSPPLCNLSNIINRLKPVNFCPRLTDDITMDVCRRYPHMVIKTIRMYSLASLEEIVRDRTLNVKIIHLMRDPRGIYISRIKAEKKMLSLGKSLDQDVSYICRRMRKNLEFVKSAPSWLEGSYIRVRYEEIAENPHLWTQKLYNFTELGHVPDDVIKWIDKNTQSTSNSNAYSTQRDSASTSQAWRKAASIDVVQQMQSLCRPVLEELGYLEVTSGEQLTNASLSLVV